MNDALEIIEAEIDRLESLVAGLQHAAELLRDDLYAELDDQDEDETVDDELVECEDCGEMFHRNGIGPHRRSHRRAERLGNVATFDPDAARAAAAAAS